MKVFQIYYREEQIVQLEPGYIPWYNKECTPFFESSVIREVVEAGHAKDTDYIGVVSYKLRQKLDYIKKNWLNHPQIANTSVTEFTPEQFEEELYKAKPDVMSFQRHVGHDPITTADTFHPNFIEHWNHILGSIGYGWKAEHYADVCYCNYFVAKGELYERYVNELLAPAMDVMQDMPELWKDSRYSYPLPMHLREKWGISWYPYHAFITERMISYFIHIHKLKCLHY